MTRPLEPIPLPASPSRARVYRRPSKRPVIWPEVGRLVRHGLKRNDMLIIELAAEAGVSRAAITDISAGRRLPRYDVASRLSEALDMPKIIAYVQEQLERRCARCERVYFAESTNRRESRYCSRICHDRDKREALRAKRPDLDWGAIKHERLSLTKRITGLEEVIQAAEADTARLTEAMLTFCRQCEWDGTCKQSDCEMRPWSPLPLAASVAA